VTDPTARRYEDPALIATSPVVTSVFEQVLAAVHEGTLLPGQRISDSALAEQFGVSRTPVREALQRLREIGIVEASASRFTRVSAVTPLQTSQAYVVWLALYRALIEEVIPSAPPETTELMRDDHGRFLASLISADVQRIAKENFDFFSRLPARSGNRALQRALISVVHIVRLGSLHLPATIDLGALGRAQGLLLEAARNRDVVLARSAMDVLGSIEVPLD
jgi:DNA-binding GntR family transcriptional regulator